LELQIQIGEGGISRREYGFLAKDKSEVNSAGIMNRS
jgi:hypothetical protein